jgi:hypothetical protein
MKRVRKFQKQLCSDLRKEMEAHVTSTNTRLKPVVRFMPITILLANCHPLERKQYAMKLFDNCELSKEDAKEYLGNYINSKNEEED